MHMLNIGVIGALLSLLMYLIYYTLAKKFAAATGNYKAAMVIMTCSIVPMLVAAYLIKPSWISNADVFLSIIGGIFVFLGFELLYRSLHTEQLTNTVGVTEVGSAIMIIFGILVLNEKISALGLIGIVMIFVGTFFIARKKKFLFNKKLVPAILASVCFGLSWVVNATAISNSGNFIIPLLISRSIAVLITIPYLHLFKKPKENESKPQKINLLNLSLMVLLMGLTAGIFDGVGDVLFGFITLHKYLALGGAFGILQIAIIAIIGYFVYKDKLKWPELAGLVVSIVGAILLAFF